jgi:hypothetical protein
MFLASTPTARQFRKRLPFVLSAFLALCCLCASSALLSSCGAEMGVDAALSKNVYMELVDWHVSGLWVINCPVAWLRIKNFNNVPIKNPKVRYATYDFEGKKLSEGVYTIEGAVDAGQVGNFIEQYLGIVDLHSDKLMVQLVGVEPYH